MRGRLAGDVALVTGAGSGIGRAVVERYVAEGAHVGALVRGTDAAAALQAELGGAVAVSLGDVRSETDLRRATDATIHAFGRLDTVVANAGLWDYGRRLEDFEGGELARAFTELFEVNVLGVLLTARVTVEALRETRGSIIVTGSPSGRHAGGGGPLYVGSKHAVEGVVRQLAFELAPDVRVNAVAPGATETPLRGPESAGLDATRLDEQHGLRRAIARRLPLGRVAAPEDHASLYVLLASRAESSFVTGAILRSDGGVDVRGGERRPAMPEVAR